jgi:hypothetical protein
MSTISQDFAAVFVETLTPELQTEFLALEPITAAGIWEIVLKNHVFVREPPMFIELGTGKCISKEAFTATYAPIVNQIDELPARYRDNPIKFAHSTFGLRLASVADYLPVRHGEIVPALVGTKYNMWKPPAITPLADRKPTIFLEHMNYVFPNQTERRMVANYLAWMVQKPEHKMSFALLIVGRRGVGKSWFSLLLKAIFGDSNTLIIEKGENVAAKFNADQANRQVIFVDELLPGGKMDVAAAIEPKITATTLTIEPKGVDKFQVANRFNIIGVSNYENALRIRGRRDRKWAIARATPDLIYADASGKETAKTAEYFTRLHAITPPDGTITDEARRVLHWLMVRKIPDEFNGHIPPDTEAKNEVADATADTIEANVNGYYADASGPFRFKLVTVDEVRESVCNLFEADADMNRQKADALTSSAMEDCGCRRITPAGTGNAQMYLPGSKNPRRLWCTCKADLATYERMSKTELVEAYKAERAGERVKAPNEFEPELG